MATLAKKSLLWVTVISLLIFLVFAIRLGVVELLSISARVSMQDWDFSQQAPPVSEIESVAQKLEWARFLDGDHPGPHEDIAYLSLMRFWMPYISAAEKKSQLQIGLSEIRTAISLRPVSPYSWTILLLIKRDLGEYDAEFRHALRRSVELGPWEPELLMWLVDVGLSAWTAMPAEEQALILAAFARAQEDQRSQVIDTFVTHQDDCAFQSPDDLPQAECQ